jgi:hypothetical protein
VKIDVKIDRMVLEGLELSRRERDALTPAIERELRRLAGEPGDRRADERRGATASTVDGIAREVAGAVHRSIGPARWPAGPRR